MKFMNLLVKNLILIRHSNWGKFCLKNCRFHREKRQKLDIRQMWKFWKWLLTMGNWQKISGWLEKNCWNTGLIRNYCRLILSRFQSWRIKRTEFIQLLIKMEHLLVGFPRQIQIYRIFLWEQMMESGFVQVLSQRKGIAWFHLTILKLNWEFWLNCRRISIWCRLIRMIRIYIAWQLEKYFLKQKKMKFQEMKEASQK